MIPGKSKKIFFDNDFFRIGLPKTSSIHLVRSLLKQVNLTTIFVFIITINVATYLCVHAQAK
jgi:hypothetical protein